ncbi:hypothetical protein KEM56_005982 [Ascosphaera pollenicola]|nr:hypothetical protein KEM56_005982 [Ascosphaera pollenicola]
MSLLLRHAAEKEGVQIDNQGYANVADVLAWRKLKSLKVTFAEVLTAVDTSDKKRFALLYNPITREKEETEEESQTETEAVESEEPFTATSRALEIAKSNQDVDPSHYLIRATQGHSLKTVEAAQLLKQIVLEDDPRASHNDATITTNIPETVVHGTFHGAWQHILDAGGLKPMSRNHIHFATGPALRDIMPDGPDGTIVKNNEGKPQGVISGMRKDSQILIYIDIRRALAAGIPFWISENGVVLSEGIDTEVNGRTSKLVPLEVFDIVVEKQKGTGVLMRQGKLTMDTPEWIKNAPLPAKNRQA